MSNVAKKCAEAAATLRELLMTAASRGITIEDSFSHFDPMREGVIDLSQFILGLRSLGIPLTVEVASLLLFQLSEKSSTHLVFSDFHRLCDPGCTLYKKRKIKPVKKKKLAPTARPPPPKRAKKSISIMHEPTTKEKALASAQGLPQWAHDRSKRALRELQHLSKKRPLPMPSQVTQGESDSEKSSDDVFNSPNQVSPPKPDVMPDLEFAKVDTEYSTFTVDKEISLQYAILQIQDNEISSERDYDATGESQALARSKESRHLDTKESRVSARIIVVLDAFQTIEMIDALLRPFFQTYPMAKILVVGHLNNLNADTIISNATMSLWMGRLILHLMETRQWTPQPRSGVGAVPQLLLGFGSGASMACHFALITALEEPKLNVLNQGFGALLLVNGFCKVDSTIKSKLHAVCRGLENNNDAECHQQLVQLLFSEGYLNQNSRDVAMAKFFEHRHNFLAPKNRMLLYHRLKNISKYHDLRTVLGNLHIPLIILHGSLNQWISSATVSNFQEQRLAVETLPLAFQSKNSIYTAWLKSGHELAQERSSFFLQFTTSVVGNILQQVTEATQTTKLDDPRTNSAINEYQDEYKRLKISLDGDDSLIVHTTTSINNIQDEQVKWTPRVQAILDEQGIKGVRQELVDRDIDMHLGVPDEELLKVLEAAFRAEDAVYQDSLEAKAQIESRQAAQHEEFSRHEKEKQQKIRRDLERKKQRLRKEELEFTTRERHRLKAEEILEAERKERQAMEFQDDHSRKREHYDAKRAEWEECNRNALHTVAELDEERKEALIAQEEINQGLQRAAQRANLQAELWDLQRKLEANQVKLRGDIEGYGIEFGVSLSIPRVLQGISCILEDAAAVRTQKKRNLAQQTTSTTKYNGYNRQLQDITRNCNNLTRALHRAENENVIAKPDAGGVIRLVPATPLAIRTLREKIQGMTREIAQLQEVTSAAMEEVTMFDRAMQSIALLQKKTEGVVKELVEKGSLMITNANEELAILREVQEKENLDDSKRLDQIHTTEARVNLLKAEIDRIHNISTKMIDSSIYIAGALQRVDKVTLERSCNEELSTLSVVLNELHEKSVAATAVRQKLRVDIKQVTENLALLLSAHGQLVKFDRFISLTTVKEELVADQVARNLSESSAAAALELLSIPNLTQIRQKKRFELTLEEKEWVALDLKLAEDVTLLYNHLSEREAQEIRLDPLYQTLLSLEQLQYILSLPNRICLALPFIKDRSHLRAHFLLRKYTCGDGSVVLNQVDENYYDPAAVKPELDLNAMLHRKLGEALRQKPWTQCNSKEQLWLACISRLEEKALLPPFPQGFPDIETNILTRVAGQAWSPQMTKEEGEIWSVLQEYGGLQSHAQQVVVVATLADIIEADERATIVVDTKEQITVLEASKCHLRARKSATHEILVNQMAVSITVSVVFEGRFGATGYKIGRLAAMLYHITSVGKPEPIGQVNYEQVDLNTSETMGRIVIQHKPKRVPISYGTYHVVIGCPSETTYSISVAMHKATPALEFVKHAKHLALTQQARLPIGRVEILELWESMRLAERKLELVEKASSKAKSLAREQESKMINLQRQLESATILNQSSTLNRDELIAQIRTHDRAFAKQCKLHAIRQEEIKDIKQGLHHLASMHAKLLLERSELESALTYARQHLPYAAARMEGPTAGFKIAYALNADYNVVKTAKMRWRDLAALRHQLPKQLTSAQRIRRKYKKQKLSLDGIERQWVLLDRIRHPDMYLWEIEAAHENHEINQKSTIPQGYALSKAEEILNAYTAPELERILTAPYNALNRKEIDIRKTMLKFRDEPASKHPSIVKAEKSASILRTLPLDALTADQKAWLALDKVLHPDFHSRLITQVAAAKKWTHDNLIAILKTPDDGIAMLDADDRRARMLIFTYDSTFVDELLYGPPAKATEKSTAFKHSLVDHTQKGQVIEVDIDARCRIVLHELDRAITNTSEFMDSSVLHSAPQRFPTKVLRLELEKELDRLLLSQLTEREEAEWMSFQNPKSLLHFEDGDDKKKSDQSINHVSDSDSDLEAQLAREQQKKIQLKLQRQKGVRVSKPSLQKQKQAIQQALVAKTVEEEQLELEKNNLGVGGCMACHSNPCHWVPYLNATKDTIVHRVHVLKDEIERVKRSKEGLLSSSVCMLAVRSNTPSITMRKMDLFLELTSECRLWEKHLRLRDIDTEFHSTFNWNQDHFVTVALHGFAQMQQTEKVKVALAREQN
ncbi:hypothetical protein THRCLA_23374, partial [Thraustotheca clavata]